MAVKDKKTFDIKKLIKDNSSSTKFKETSYYNLGPSMSKLGINGIPRGHITQIIGHSDTGKTTSMLLAIKSAMEMGDIPVIMITEGKWDFNRLKLVGAPIHQNEDGSWEGNFIYRDDLNTVEEWGEFINDLLKQQEKSPEPFNLFFCTDSIGTIPCQMTYEGKGGKQHTASKLSDIVGLNLHHKITRTRKEECPYYSTMLIINQCWVFTPQTYMAQPVLKPKGGEAIYTHSSMVLKFGATTHSSKTKIDAVKGGRKVLFGHKTKITLDKDHINGKSFNDVKIISVPHGYIDDTKEAIEEYKKKYSDYWKKELDVTSLEDIELEENEIVNTDTGEIYEE